MQVILIQDVDNLGARYELVTVKNGYARNFLIPRKMAIEANPSNLKQHEEKLKVIAKKEAAMLAELNKVIDILKSSPVKVSAKPAPPVRYLVASLHCRLPVRFATRKVMRSIASASLLQRK